MGKLVGSGVGVPVGSLVGAGIGSVVGAGIGSAVGLGVGAGDGTFVGLGLGGEVGAMYFATVPATLITARESESRPATKRSLAAGSHAMSKAAFM